MNTASFTPESARVSGLVLLAFRQSFLTLNLYLDDKSRVYLDAIQGEAWYPLKPLLRMFRALQRHYTALGPIHEQIGLEFIAAISQSGLLQPMCRSGIDFLQAHRHSGFYNQMVRGEPADLGRIELLHLDVAAGAAVIHSTTPFSRDLERGVLLGGLRLTRSCDAVDVDNTQHPDYFQVRWFTATPAGREPLTPIAASDFLAATRLTADRVLAGSELQHVFWHYKALEKELARQRTYWESTNAALAAALRQLQAQKRELRAKNVEIARAHTAYLHDLTQRERMAQALRESEQRFRSIAEANPVPMGIVSLEDARWLYVSPSLARLVGRPVAEMVGTRVENLYPDPEAQQRFRQKLRREGVVETHEFALARADGSTIPVAVTAQRIVYEGTEAILGGIIDLSERQRAEQDIARQREALYQSEKLSALGSLLAGVAHELNNPLSVVVGRAIMLQEEITDPAVASAVERMRQAAERCAQIVKTFLAMARQQPQARTPVNLNAAITTTLELVGYSLRTAGIDVHLDLSPDLPEFSADAIQLQQVIMNLVVNARQALLEAPEPRHLAIATRYERRSGLLRMVITDNGPGVPEAIRSRIFDPFFTTKSTDAGTGVGLSLSHGIVTAHGGTLALENPPQGGARFVVTLPLIKAAPPVEVDAPRGDVEPRPHAILIVDDEAELAEMLSDILRRAGHQTTIAASGNAALSQLAARDYDVILSDVHMPNLNGLDLYRHVQHAHPHLRNRIIFMTGDTLGATVRHFLQETGVPHLEKPLIPREVIRLVQDMLS